MRYGMTMRANLRFFKNLFGLLVWKTLNDDDSGLGVVGKHGESLWFIGGAKDVANDYDGPGMNHLGIDAEAQVDVDEAAHLTAMGVELLFDTPRHGPDFAADAADTYSQIMFGTPDRLRLEFVYTGPKQA
jgi:hypothetical protein